MQREKSHNRAPGQVSISVSMSKDERERIDALARKDKRSRSNYLRVVLAEILEHKEKEGDRK